MSSMLSAPATMPATSAGTFTWALTPPASRNVSVPATRPARSARPASAITGASPAHDTRFGSSNTA
jgi:hypothetical protein